MVCSLTAQRPSCQGPARLSGALGAPGACSRATPPGSGGGVRPGEGADSYIIKYKPVAE